MNFCVVIPAYNPGKELCELVSDLLTRNSGLRFVIVNDGSKEECASVFDELSRKESVKILRHAVNLGKGAALKTAFNHILLMGDVAGVVTADADGQHLPEDIIGVGQELMRHSSSLVLGCRSFSQNVPLRSKFGNSVTALVAKFLLGKNISDTQTGLRGIPLTMLPTFMRMKATGYDFEMEMLVTAVSHHFPITQYPVATVYLDGNKSSHFNPLRDSLAIYYVFFRHMGNSLATAVIDYFVFCLAFLLTGTLGPSLIIGRFFAGAFNFFTAKWLVFKSGGNTVRELTLYVFLVCVLTYISYLLIDGVHGQGVPLLLAKIMVEGAVFLVAFSVQRTFVFRENPAATDWDTYYNNRKFSISMRHVTERLLVRIFLRQAGSAVSSITELGGGDSCFYNALRKVYPSTQYTVVDNSGIGISLFQRKHAGEKISAVHANILEPLNMDKAEVVFSVGLIEHFSPEQTSRCIAAHFEAVKPGGLVLISYPTPSVPYRVIRSLAEVMHIWRFHDERPLTAEEVVPQMARYGDVVHQSKNWWIGLTQEIVAVRVRLL